MPGDAQPDPRDDPALVRAAQGGCARSFAALIERHHGLVRALVSRAGTAPAEAEDLAQEAWLLAWRRLPALRDPARWKGWVAEIALNTGRLRARRRRVEAGALPALERRAVEAGGREADDPLVLEEERREVLAALDALPGEARALVVERYVEERSAPEIAASLGIAAEAVRQRLARALRALRERLGHEARRR